VVRSSVIIRVGPVQSSFGIDIGWSDEGPIAAEYARLNFWCDSGCDLAGLFSLDKSDADAEAFLACAEDEGGEVDFIADFDEKLLISTGVEERGRCESGPPASVIS
jgi:hypothetical protein